VSFGAWLDILEPPWKRFGAVKIVPEWVEMIKTELGGMEYGWVLGGSGIWRQLKTISIDIYLYTEVLKNLQQTKSDLNLTFKSSYCHNFLLFLIFMWRETPPAVPPIEETDTIYNKAYPVIG
jgi:hypothetical protein